MQSVETLTHRFEKHFQPGQANVLAEVIHESYTDLVKTSDFTELKGAVTDLTDAQKQTEQQVKELAGAQKRTEQRVEELAGAQKRTEQRVEKLAQAQERTEEKVKELAEGQKELQEGQKLLQKEQAKTEAALRQMARQMGGLSEAFGGSLEGFAIDIVPEILEKNWGLVVKSVKGETFTVNGRSKEIDMVIRGSIEGRPVVVLGEVKSNLTKVEVYRFLKLSRQIAASLPDCEVRTLFFGYRANGAVRDAIQSERAYMVFTHGRFL